MLCGVQFATRTTNKVTLLTTTLSKIPQRPPAHQMKNLHRYVEIFGLSLGLRTRVVDVVDVLLSVLVA